MVRLNEMTGPELSAVADKYPWFSACRAVLCRKVTAQSGFDAGSGLYKDFILWLPDAAYLASVLRSLDVKDYSDSGLSEAIREMIEVKPQREVYDGMDFFCRKDYESVRRENDASLGKMAVVDYSEPAAPVRTAEEQNFNPISETLAQIFADQGYPERAIEIYKALSLQSPEKSAYFAGLIEKLNS